MSTSFSRFLSWMLHPSFLPTFLASIVFYSFPFAGGSLTLTGRLMVLSIVFLFTCFLPGLSAVIMKKTGVIYSLEMDSTAERRLPFLAGVIYYFTGYYLFTRLHVSPVMTLIMLGATAAAIVAMMINLFWKISIHMIGIGSVCGLLAGLSARFSVDLFFPFVLFVFLSGLLGSARLSLQAHSPGQIYAGFLAGFICEFALLAFV